MRRQERAVSPFFDRVHVFSVFIGISESRHSGVFCGAHILDAPKKAPHKAGPIASAPGIAPGNETQGDNWCRAADQSGGMSTALTFFQ